MAETDFNDLLNAAEQLASEVDGSGELPRVERTLRQVLEASQDLWARVTTTGAQEIQANLLLGSKGVDLPQLSQKLESLSTKKTFEPLEPIPDTDIESFLKNETENAIISLIESTHSDTHERLRSKYKESVRYEWEVEKMKLMNSILGKDGKEYLDMPLVQERTVLNEKVIGTKSFLSSHEMMYARALLEYHQSVIQNEAQANLIDKFAEVALRFNDQMANELWTIVKYMIQIQGKGDPIYIRNTPVVKSKMISQARTYLENRYHLYMSSVVQSSLREAQRGGKPGTYSLVRSFVGIRFPRGYINLDPAELDERPLWPLIYYCLRCGDVQAALKCAQQAGSGFEEICKALQELKESPQRKLSPKMEKQIRTHYKRNIRNNTDPFKRVIFSILGGCDINYEHPEIVKTADDYLWLKLNQVCEDEKIDRSDGFESLSYSLLQTLVIEEYGEAHYNASEQPHVYFQLLFLTCQWEAAIDFLIRNDKLRVHGVHVAIVLHDLDLLALPVDIKSPLLIVDAKDPKPSHRLNFARLIMIYVHKFESQDLLEALHYYFCLRALKTVEGDNVFALFVSELVMKTGQFETILGHLELDGCHSLGLIDQFRGGNNIDIDLVIDRVAQTAESSGHYENAIKLYDLSGKHDDVLRLMSTLLSQVIARFDSEPCSLRSRLAAYAENITVRYAGIQLKCDRGTQATFYTLRDLLMFFDCYAQKQYPEALDIIQRSRLIPLSLDDVDEKVKNFQTLNEVICRNIPDVLLATMNMLYTQYMKIKGDAQGTPRAYFADSLKEQLSFIRERAKAITSFAGTVPYRMPADTNNRLVQIEILMH